MNRLQGKTAVITGGNSGVGAAAAILFASEGANVVISARRQNALDEVAEKIKAAGGNVLTVPTDISKDGDCKALMKAAADKFGTIDILINNAGVLDTGLKAIDKYLDDDAERVIAINDAMHQGGARAHGKRRLHRKRRLGSRLQRRRRRGLRRVQSGHHRHHQAHRHASGR